MSDYTDKLTSQMLVAAALARTPSIANPIQATVSSVSVNGSTGARSIFVAYGGAVDIPAIWSSAFDVAVQVQTGGNLALLVGTEVMVVTSSSPPYIADMIVRS